MGKKPMKFEVILRSIHEERPSGHNPSAQFRGGISYKETFWCSHAREHAQLFIKLFDLSAQQCGIDKGEFKQDLRFTHAFHKLEKQIESLHSHILKTQNAKGKQDVQGLDRWVDK